MSRTDSFLMLCKIQITKARNMEYFVLIHQFFYWDHWWWNSLPSFNSTSCHMNPKVFGSISSSLRTKKWDMNKSLAVNCPSIVQKLQCIPWLIFFCVMHYVLLYFRCFNLLLCMEMRTLHHDKELYLRDWLDLSLWTLTPTYLSSKLDYHLVEIFLPPMHGLDTHANDISNYMRIIACTCN